MIKNVDNILLKIFLITDIIYQNFKSFLKIFNELNYDFQLYYSYFNCITLLNLINSFIPSFNSNFFILQNN